MTAWTNAIDAQIAALDAYVVTLNAERARLVVQQGFSSGQRVDEITAAIEDVDEMIAGRDAWRAMLVVARSLGYLPDPNSQIYERLNG
jgi:hypothetical protein